MLTHQRKSNTPLGNIYFWTATIHKWYHLMENDERKDLIVAYLKKLSDDGLLTIYAFVIMPNHMHLVFRQNGLNGKETPKGSLLKYTAHTFLKQFKIEGNVKPYHI